MQPPRAIDLPSVHHSPRGTARVWAIVVHATAGTDSRAWLQRNPNGVSAHALISRDGTVYRMVPDDRAAHHVGYSRIVVGGRIITRSTQPNPNQVTLGVELENRNDGREPYPQAQRSALGWLLAQWTTAHPDARLVFHREIDTQGKTDPAGLDWLDIHQMMAPWLATPTAPARAVYTADSPILAPPGLSRVALAAAMVARCGRSPYEPAQIAGLAYALYDYGAVCGVDPVPAAAQCCHETANLTSPRSQPPQHNTAGIGATNDGAAGLFFPSLEASARAQLGRLVAYATTPDARTSAQQDIAAIGLAARPLPLKCQGSAPTLRLLGADPNAVDGCGWASPGTAYGEALARVANALVELV